VVAIDDDLGRDAKAFTRTTGFSDSIRCRTRMAIVFIGGGILGIVIVVSNP